MTGPATAPPAPLSLVDLAHAAEQAIARYVDAVDKACAAVGKGPDVHALLALERVRLVAYFSLQDLWIAPGWLEGSGDALRMIHDMRVLVGQGIVRPEWGLRVVQIATAEQARRAGDG